MAPDQQRVLVYCANGFQGQAIVTALLSSGCRVRALIRDEAKAASLATAGAEICQADLDDGPSLRKAHDDIDVAVVQLPSGSPPDAARAEAANALDAIRACGITKIVWNSSVDFPTRSGELPQFAAKRDAERQVLASGLQVTVIRSPFLLSNLLLPWARQSVAAQGVLAYPVAADVSLCWAAPEHIGCLVSMVVGGQLYGHTLHAGAKTAITGDELASVFSAALDRNIRYMPLRLDAFEEGVDAALGPGIGREVGAIFRFIDRHADDRDFVSHPFWVPADFPPVEPTSIAHWVRAHAHAFSHAGGAVAGPSA
jgi:uncharacterized protein YbjT (DUF2867 family)